jgi:hypothetical protein
VSALLVASGVLIVSTSTIGADDLRYGAIAAGFARAGKESFVAADTARPPADAERQIVRARRLLDDARRDRRQARYRPSASSSDRAIRILESNAGEKQHLDLLVEALVERGAAAIALEDPAKAETVFLEAIALSPQYELDDVLYGDEVRRLFGDVHRASRQLRYGSIRVEVEGMADAAVSIDFDAPRDPPYEAKLPDGRHFVTVSAPGRYEVVAFVPVRAGRQTDVFLRPPTAGDARAREEAIAKFRGDAASIVALSQAAGLRFVAVTRADRSNVSLIVHDGADGAPVPGAEATLSANPGPKEIDAAVAKLVAAIDRHDPSAVEAVDEGTPWYASWWLWSIVGVAIAGGATATALVLTQRGDTEYRFER